MTAVGVARARDLSNGKHIPMATIKRMHSYFARHEVDKKGEGWGKDSAGYIAWLGWGGDAGRSWVNGIIRKNHANESQEVFESMASSKAAVVRGIFIRPGVSKNNRLYTKENIGKAIFRMQEHLASGEGLPLTMATSHAAAFQDDALSTVGRITKVMQLPDGSGQFEAEIANTSQGRDIAALAVGKFIKGVSIRGEWLGELGRVTQPDGTEASTASDLRIVGVDFTHSPGVDGAEIKYAVLAESFASSPYNIVESVEPIEIVARDESIVAKETADIIRGAVDKAVENAVATIMEKDSTKPYGDVAYADPGYQQDKQKRYPINGAGHVRAAWSYINQPKNAKKYTAAQLARIKSRIKSAAKKFGVNIVSEHEMLTDEIFSVLEAYASIALVNDDDSISITGYATDPHQLKTVANRIAFGAIAAMHAIDPDDDGDIYLSKPDWSKVDATGDAGGMSPEDEDSMDDNNMECEHCGNTDCPEGSNYCHACGESLPSFDNPKSNVECESCGAECSEDAIHCHMCGVELPKAVTSNALGCGNCGATAPQDAMYCPTCGDPVPQAESTDEASNLNEEEVKVENNTTEAVTSAEETATAGLTLSTADLQAIAKMVIAGLKPAESTEPAADAEAEIDEPAEVKAEEPAEEIVAEEPAAEVEATESNSQEIDVTDNMFTAEQVQAIVAEAAAKAATAAVEAARNAAVEDYRAGRGVRKGLTSSTIANDASDLSEAEFTPEMLAEMTSTQFRKAQNEVWSNSPFFQAKFAQADRGF